MLNTVSALAFALALVVSVSSAEQPGVPDVRIPPGSNVFIAPMNGFDAYLIAAFTTKKVPLRVVGAREQADFELVGVSESQKPGWVRNIIGETGTDEQASIVMKSVRTGDVAFGYAVNMMNVVHGHDPRPSRLPDEAGNDHRTCA
jgi:hypothetical protein